MIAVDFSEDGGRVIAVVGAREHVLKSGEFLKVTKWVKHFRRVGSDRRRSYLALFPKRFVRVKRFLDLVRVCLDVSTVQSIVEDVKPLVVIVDDKLYSKIRYPRKVREGRVKERHREKLSLIADNLANYFRVILKEKPRKFREELRRFEK